MCSLKLNATKNIIERKITGSMITQQIILHRYGQSSKGEEALKETETHQRIPLNDTHPLHCAELFFYQITLQSQARFQ